MPYNSETETFDQDPATVVDSTPDGDTVQEGFDDRLTPALAGVYADLNLLKADGMISVGIPATTTARGIGRVATAADALPGSTITNGPAFLEAGAVKITHTPTANAVPQADASGKLDGWVSLAGKANKDLSNLEPTAGKVILGATKVKNLGSRTTSGTWTLTDVEIGRPLFIVTGSTSTANDQGVRLKVESGATGGTSGSTDGPFLIGRGATLLSTDVFITFPTDSTVIIAVASVSNATAYARQ